MTLTLHHPHADLFDVGVGRRLSLKQSKVSNKNKPVDTGSPGLLPSHRGSLPPWQAR